jgi:hypothetical protein
MNGLRAEPARGGPVVVSDRGADKPYAEPRPPPRGAPLKPLPRPPGEGWEHARGI